MTALEMQLMQVLWEHGACTVLEVQSQLRPAKELAYTTVQTVLNTLHRKKKVRRKLEGRAYRYQAVSSRENVLRQAIAELADRMFRGSAEELVMSLVKSRHVDAARIAEWSRTIAAEDEGDA
jgi:predicted transcriptional regulator